MGERLSPIGQFYGHHPNSKAWPKCGQNVKISSPHVPSALQSSLKGMAVLRPACQQMGRRRWSPLGGFNPPPTEGGARRAGSTCFNPNTETPDTNIEHLVASDSEIFLFPSLYSLPRRVPYTANPPPKSGKVWFFHIFG